MRTRNTDKEQLVKEKAIELLVSEGFEGFTVNKLAKLCKISVATIYIYYKDKDDLITKIATEEAKRLNDMSLRDFNPEMHFAEGLRNQWKNRFDYLMENPYSLKLMEQLRTSTYQRRVAEDVLASFKLAMEQFMKNAEERGEINKLPIEVYWSVAFAPLYSLVRFHHEGRNMGGKPFTMKDKVLWETFDLVLKALKP